MRSTVAVRGPALPTDRDVLTLGWLLVGATLPLSGIDELRYELTSKVHLAVPMLALGLAAAWGVAMLAVRLGRLQVAPAAYRSRTVVVAALAFFAWHLLALLWSPNVTIALRETIKVGVGVGILMLAVGVVPYRPHLIARFWVAALWSGTILSAWLVYASYYVWHSAILSTSLSVQSNIGRNQFAGMLAYLTPMAAAYAWGRPRQVLRYLPLATLIVALLYSGSRGGSIAIVTGMTVMFAASIRSIGWFRTIRYVTAAVGLAVASALAVVMITGLDTTFLKSRWMYLYDPSSAPQFDSYAVRSGRAMTALEIAVQKPIAGWGLGELEQQMGTLPHNDYTLVFGDLGGVGVLLLLSLLAAVAVNLFYQRVTSRATGWVTLGARGALAGIAVFMLTMDRIYTTPAFWLVLGIMLAGEGQATRLLAARPVP